MGFWPLIVTMILGIVVIEAIKDVAKHRMVNKNELKTLQEDITEIKKELQEIKESIADLIIKSDQI